MIEYRDDFQAVPLSGADLLQNPIFNKGSAFTAEERRAFSLEGLLPFHTSTMEEQLDRTYADFQQKPDDLEKHIFLRALQDRNETLFYRLLLEHITEMMPLVYTPVVGAACQRFSHIFRRPRGLFISYPQRDEIDRLLDNRAFRDVDVIVVTDGERILGLGDQGAGGMGIPVGKLSLYTLCGGIHPARTLPILLDTGTDNQERLDDPLYLGWRHPRVRGQEYDDFIETFVQAVMRKLPNVLLQWEDFARDNAARLLERYRDRLCTFNDDIQGTAAITVATLLSAMKAAGGRLRDQRFVILGAGSAATGIADLLAAEMVTEGVTRQEALRSFYLLNSRGLLVEGMEGLQEFQLPFVQPRSSLEGWSVAGEFANLEETVRYARPTVLIGVSGQPGAFSEEIVRLMGSNVERPIIFPLSNPTSKSEAIPADLIRWTDGRAIVATGSPFTPVEFNGRSYLIAQCNNSYIFPGMGLGVLASGARRVNDEMFLAAAKTLAELAPARTDPNGPLLPPLTEIRTVSKAIAVAVARTAVSLGLAPESPEAIHEAVERRMWFPAYRPLTSA